MSAGMAIFYLLLLKKTGHEAQGTRQLAVCMTCVTWVVVEIVTQELVAVMRHSVEV